MDIRKVLTSRYQKRKVFTKEVLSRVLQDELRDVANKEVDDWFGEQIKRKVKRSKSRFIRCGV